MVRGEAQPLNTGTYKQQSKQHTNESKHNASTSDYISMYIMGNIIFQSSLSFKLN